jgi:hypothetical protein
VDLVLVLDQLRVSLTVFTPTSCKHKQQAAEKTWRCVSNARDNGARYCPGQGASPGRLPNVLTTTPTSCRAHQ